MLILVPLALGLIILVSVIRWLLGQQPARSKDGDYDEPTLDTLTQRLAAVRSWAGRTHWGTKRRRSQRAWPIRVA